MTWNDEPLASIRSAIERVSRDVTATVGWAPTCSVVGPDEDGNFWVGDGPLACLSPGDDPEDFVARLADELSETISEGLADQGNLHLARTWPPCPRHDHSLTPVVAPDGRAVWSCREDPRVNTPIGRLGPP